MVMMVISLYFCHIKYTIMKNTAILFILFALMTNAWAQISDNTVEVNYNGTTATVAVADNVLKYLTVTQEGAHVSIAQSDSLASEITYKLSGTVKAVMINPLVNNAQRAFNIS